MRGLQRNDTGWWWWKDKWKAPWNIYFNEWFLHQSSASYCTDKVLLLHWIQHTLHSDIDFLISWRIIGLGTGKEERAGLQTWTALLRYWPPLHTYLYNSIWHWVLWYYIEGDIHVEATLESGGGLGQGCLWGVFIWPTVNMCCLKLLHLKYFIKILLVWF